jgi:hypothetical protein
MFNLLPFIGQLKKLNLPRLITIFNKTTTLYLFLLFL